MDYSRLRAAALRDGEDEEAVTVDTRALIDKVLARYSGEWTTLRELIQNAADAQATSVQIKWETLPSTQVPLPQTTDRSELLKHVITHHTARRLLVQNNGQPFTKTDWGRLKRIAEGNPDESKIGAFGVGFYSVFADCEEPFVSSGSEAMAFYWKGNALFTRKLQLPPEQSSSDTAFVLDYRNATSPLPNLLSVSQFLATSLTFVALQSIEFWIDDYKVLSLQKKSSPSAEITIPRDIESRTKDGLMSLASVDRSSAQIDATVMGAVGWKSQTQSANKNNESFYFGSSAPEVPSLRNFFSRLTSSSTPSGSRSKATKEERAPQEAVSEDLTATTTSSIFLRVTSALVRTQVSASFASELERATKKPPPKTTKLSILTSSHDETAASEASSASNKTATDIDVFSTVLPSKKPGGRIFIGFPTTQTTGAGMHISAPSVIPTVEREAIDLNARWVRTWNVEMLRVAGIMTRLAFANEMSDLNDKFKRELSVAKQDMQTVVAKLMPEASHILKTYTFTDSTPSSHVAQIIEEAFWTAYRRPSIEMYSSRGVLSTAEVRIGSEELANIVDSIPTIPPPLKETPLVKKLTDFGLIRDITVDDMVQELGKNPLNRQQMQHLIVWAAKNAVSGQVDPASKQRLFEVAVAVLDDGEGHGEIIALASIENYLVPSRIPPNLPVPPTTIPLTFTTNIPFQQLQALGWSPLDIVPWLRYLVQTASSKEEDQNMMKSAKFAAQVLLILSKNWDSLGQSSRDSVVSTLQNNTVVPTKMGMKKPGESFFSSVKLFDDLPIVQNCPGVKDKFLAAIGVRKTVDLDTIFTRLLNPSPESGAGGANGQHGRWSHMELIKYLASVKDDIPAADMKKLKESRICPAEAGPKGMEPTKGTTKLFKVSELFEPKDDLRTLNLPILHWPGPPGSFRSSSSEGTFLYSLGLRGCPAVPELVDMMASQDATLRANAMAYFIGNHHLNGYASFNLAATNKAILPLQGNEKRLVSPQSCFTNEGAAVLGFDILRKDLHQHALKFGVAKDPPITNCVDEITANPPADRNRATALFEYFSTRLVELGENNLAKLRGAPIVPVTRKKQGFGEAPKQQTTNVVHLAPQNCYLGSSSTYGDIFDFVDFGSSANTFLYKCGARSEPNRIEIARLACNEPARLLSILQSPERYLNLLRTLAEDLRYLKSDKELFKQMKKSPFLLGFKELSSASSSSFKGQDPEFFEDEAPIRQYQLASAQQIVILDDFISYRLFKDHLVCAPEEDGLEALYMALGSQALGTQIREDLKIGPHAPKQDAGIWLHKHVLERSKIFLYEYSKYKRESIQHDSKWLEKNLKVEVVRTLALRRSLHGQTPSHTEKRSAASARSNGGHILYITSDGRPDMYQVGQAVCHLLLSRPSQQAYFFFEPFLKLDLLDLRARGYNVDRILRAKAAEARIAEEERRKALEAEEKRVQELDREWEQQTRAAPAAKEAVKTPETDKMPGAFGDYSPEDDLNNQLQPFRKKTRSIFSSLTRRFGLDEGESQQKQLEQAPAPAHPEPESGKSEGLGGSSAASQGQEKQKQKDPKGGDGRVTSPAVVQQNLLNAIKSTRAHDATNLFSPPQQSQVKEQETYCDSNSAHNIDFAAVAPQGMRVFLAKDLSGSPTDFLTTNTAAIGRFEALLRDAGRIYGLAPDSLHIFYEETGGTIAFNSNGSIFCNLRFFLQLHADKISGGRVRNASVEVTAWWWVVLAHELAHNLVSPHNSEHSYYT